MMMKKNILVPIILLLLTACEGSILRDILQKSNQANLTLKEEGVGLFPVCSKKNSFGNSMTCGYIDKTGKMSIPPQPPRPVMQAEPFSEGLAVMYYGAGSYHYINYKGEIISPLFSAYNSRQLQFSEGFAPYMVSYENTDGSSLSPKYKKVFGYIDTKMNIMIKPQFVVAEPFSEGLAGVAIDVTPKGSYSVFDVGYIDKSGKVVLKVNHNIGGYGFHSDSYSTEIHPFSEGLAFTCPESERSGCAFIDKQGNYVIKNLPYYQPDALFWGADPTLNYVRFSEGLAGICSGAVDYVDYRDIKCTYINKTGNVVIEPKFSGSVAVMVLPFSEGLAPVAFFDSSFDRAKYGYIDKSGELVIQPKFAFAQPFSQGLAKVEMSSEENSARYAAYINKKGDVVWDGVKNQDDFKDNMQPILEDHN